MNDLTPHTATTDADKAGMPINPEALDRASDEALKVLIAKAQSLLGAREDTRKREAIAKIKELAKAHGLDVAIEPKKRQRRRKPKAET